MLTTVIISIDNRMKESRTKVQILQEARVRYFYGIMDVWRYL